MGRGAATAASSGVSSGDGYVNLAAGEQCDDGNATNGDGCSAACRLE
jgi:cysteine-rich repeat protein